MLFSARIKELETQLGAAQGQAQENFSLLTTANEALAQAEADNGVLTGERDALTGTNTTLTTDLVTARADLATRTTELATEQTGREAAIFDQVNVRLSAAGVAPIKRDPAGPDTPVGKGGSPTGTPRERLAAGFTVAAK
jgi:hypothetical protein